jgi:hypothetical protein
MRIISTLLIVLLTGALLFATFSCKNGTNTSQSVDFFPVEVIVGQWDALHEGTLELKNGYLRVDDYLVIWPPDYSWRSKGEKIQVLNERKKVFATVGDSVKLGGGGSKSISVAEYYIEQKLPEGCEGPFWIVSELTVK